MLQAKTWKGVERVNIKSRAACAAFGLMFILSACTAGAGDNERTNAAPLTKKTQASAKSAAVSLNSADTQNTDQLLESVQISLEALGNTLDTLDEMQDSDLPVPEQ